MEVLSIGRSDGGGRCETTHQLYAKIHKKHTERDRFNSCYFIKSDVIGNTNGATSAIGTNNVTGLGTPNINVSVNGTVTTGTGTSIPFSKTQGYEVGYFGWNLQ